eukprot:m.82264 g.82264  ORF g.82264 m.82264 type:complete len:146 (-) comp12682_c0_seq1:400-837(-)
MATKPAPDGVKLDPSAIVCQNAILEGEITIEAGTIVHPCAVIRATAGPILIGKDNMIEDRAVIENTEEGVMMVIGDGNVFGPDSRAYITRKTRLQKLFLKFNLSPTNTNIHVKANDSPLLHRCSLPKTPHTHTHVYPRVFLACLT